MVQLIVPPYRVAFIREVRRSGCSLAVAAGNASFEPTVGGADAPDLDLLPLRNRFLFHRRLAYQGGYRRAVGSAGVCVIELNPRIVNSWLTLIEARLRGRRVIVWGHYKGRGSLDRHPGVGRSAMVRLSRGVIAYTYADAGLFAKRFPAVRVFVAPNATELASAIAPVVVGRRRTDFLFVGRLIESKGVAALVEGFVHARTHGILPPEARLVLVGTGPEAERAKAISKRHSMDESVLFVGEVFGSAELDRLYAQAVAGVCGGYVGLNVTQSLSRGVPVIFPRTAPHSPEVSVAEDDISGFQFDGTSASSVAASLGRVWDATSEGRIDHRMIQVTTLAQYSVELMAAGFVDAIHSFES